MAVQSREPEPARPRAPPPAGRASTCPDSASRSVAHLPAAQRSHPGLRGCRSRPGLFDCVHAGAGPGDRFHRLRPVCTALRGAQG